MSKRRHPQQPTEQPAPVVALFYGELRTGEPCAAELCLAELEVLGGVVLCVGRAETAARAWEACAYARLALRREYSETERRANAKQGRGVSVTEVGTGYALALERRGGTTAALLLEVEEGRPHSPEVLAMGDRLSCWSALHAWAIRNAFPRGFK